MNIFLIYRWIKEWDLPLYLALPVNEKKCDLKWRNIWITYKANVIKFNLSGWDSFTWEYYDVLDEYIEKYLMYALLRIQK